VPLDDRIVEACPPTVERLYDERVQAACWK